MTGNFNRPKLVGIYLNRSAHEISNMDMIKFYAGYGFEVPIERAGDAFLKAGLVLGIFSLVCIFVAGFLQKKQDAYQNSIPQFS